MDVSKERGIILKRNTSTIVLTGLFAAMITLMTAFIGHIPYGVHGGYIHFGDTLIYLAACLLPTPYALAAAAIGGGMADFLTAPMWAPATIIIKMLLVIPFTDKSGRLLCLRNVAASFAAAPVSIIGYYLAEGLLFGSFVAPAASVFGNIVQSAGSAILFFILAVALEKAQIKQRMGRLLNH